MIYCFWMRIALASAFAFIFVHFLLNQLLDFDQTCIVTLVGGGEEVTLSFFLGHSGKCPKYGFCALSSALDDGF